MKNKKQISFLKFILRGMLCLIVFSLLAYTGFNYLGNLLFNKIDEKYYLIYIIGYNITWILISILEMFLIYRVNKKCLVNGKLNIAKNIYLLLFYLFSIVLNIKVISQLSLINYMLMSIFVLIHICIIWYLNTYLFEKYWKCNKSKLDLLSLVFGVMLFILSIFIYEYISYEKSSVVCRRENGDIVSIRVNENQIISIKKNNIFVSDEELLQYNFTLLMDFVYNHDKYSESDELIKSNLKSVVKYEEENKSSCENY